ncbi:MAG: efflux RND transporter periplasmic adaptor subunit [Myxococcota bacterium]
MTRAVQRSVGVAIVVAAVGAAAWFGGVLGPGSDGDVGEAQASAGEPEQAHRVEAEAAERGTIASHIEATANLVAHRSVSVVAEAPGRVTKLGAEEGDEIRGGALLVALDASDAARTKKTAQIKLRASEAARTRTKALADQRLVAAEELDTAVTDRDLAKQELSDAEATLRRARIRAPFGGRVTKRTVERGQYVNIGDPLYDVTDFSTLLARIHIPERDAMQLDVGREAEVVLQAKPDVTFVGHVQRIASVVDVKSGTVEVTIEVQDAPAHVRSGSFVGLRLLREQHDDAVLIPREAVLVDHQGEHVYVLDGTVARRRSITVGATESGRAQVVEGLESGESVVVAGHGALQDGADVELAPAKAD